MPTQPRRGFRYSLPELARRRFRLGFTTLEDRSVPSSGSTGQHNHEDGLEFSTMPPSHSFLATNGFLTGPQSGDRETAARNTLLNFAGKAGLTATDIQTARITDSYTSLDRSHVYFRQTHHGLPIINADAGVSLMDDGRAVAVNLAFVPNVAQTGPANQPSILGPIAAVEKAAASLGYVLTTPPTLTSSQGGLRETVTIAESEFSDLPIVVERGFVNTPRGVRPVWELSARTPDLDHWFHVTVDTQDGAVEFQSDWVDNFGTYNVLPYPNESPNDGPRNVLVNPADPIASPFGWHDTDGVAGGEFTDTRGNNVFAQEDLDANNTGGTRPDGGPSRIFNNPLNLALDPLTYLPAATTNLFYANNIMHDVTQRYGFDEASGNFQQKNYTGAGLGNDAVQADALDGSGTDNANFGTPPDGSAPRMQMFRFTLTTPNRDSDFENAIIAHEYGHGISNRLTGGPANSSALTATQSGGMGEGWSDFWSLMLTQLPTDQPNDRYPMGTYVLGQNPATGNGIRSFPYSFSLAINPMTFADYGTGTGQSTQVHFAGSRWNSALWDLNWLLINKHGFDPDLSTGYSVGSNGPAGAGNKLLIRLVLDGMKLQPVNPSFIQARDAILAADVALTGGQNLRELWTGFARRGLGFSATTANSSDTNINEAFDLPPNFAAAPGVTAQTPNGVTTTSPSSITLTFSEAMNNTSFSVANDVVSFTGPGGTNLIGAITGFAWTTSTTLRIDFNAQTTPGAYSMVVGPNILAADNGAAMDQDFDGTAGEATQDRYAANFRFDPAVLQVTAITPTNNSIVPVGLTAIDVTFSEPVLASSLTAADLQLSQGTATGVTLLTPTQARFTVDLSSIAGEGQVFLSLKYGAATDAAGFASLPFNSSFSLDITTLAFPTPLTNTNPLGSLVYDTVLALTTFVNPASDTDAFTITLDANQRLTAIVTPVNNSTTFLPVVTLLDPANTTIATTTGTVAGSEIMANAAVSTAGTYTIRISGTGGTTGQYSLRLLLNAVGEGESFNQGPNDTSGTAQALTNFVTPTAGVEVASIVGRIDPIGKLPTEIEPNNTTATANDASKNFVAAPSSNIYQLSWTGVTTLNGTVPNQDWVAIGSLDVGDVITITATGSAGGFGTLSDPLMQLWRTNSGTLVVESDDEGIGLDSIIYRFSVTVADTYFIMVRQFSNLSTSGTYRVGVRLEDTGTAPSTGGNFTQETEPNDTLGAANDASTSWRKVQNVATTGATLAAGEQDNFAYNFTAGDRVTIRVAGATVSTNVALLDATDKVLQFNDNTGASESSLYSFVIPTTGKYTVRVQGVNATTNGAYTLDIFQSGTTPQAPSLPTDFYSLSLAANQTIGLGLLRTTGTTSTVELLDSAGTVVATGAAGGNYSQFINATVSKADTYRVRVNDPSGPSTYQLTAVRGAAIDRENNTTSGTAQPITLGDRLLGGITAGDSDWYSFTVPAGLPTIRFRSFTPGDATGEFVNTLNPMLELYDSGGTLIASDDNSEPDGRNAFLLFPAAVAGTYRVRILGSGSTKGEYVLTTNLFFSQPPTNVSAGGPYTIDEGKGVTLTGSATDPEGDPLTYVWDLNGDNIFTDAVGPTPSLTWAQLVALGLNDGTKAYSIRVRATDGMSVPVISSASTLTITNVAPTGSPTNSGPIAESSATPLTVAISAGTDPSPVDVLAGFTYSFDFNNDGTFEVVGSTSNSATVPAALLVDGPTTKTVRMAITDKDGASTIYFTTITINNAPPTGTLTNGGGVPEGGTATGTVNLTNLGDPSPDDLAAGLKYSYDFDNNGTFDKGDGTYAGSLTTTTMTVPASFFLDGPFNRVVLVRIFDRDGGFSDVTTTIPVLNVAPQSALNGTAAGEGQQGQVSFDTPTDPSAADTTAGFRYAFDFDNDGTFDLGGTTYATSVTTKSVVVPGQFLANSGTVTIRGRVYDRDDGFTDYTVDVVVTNIAPSGILGNSGSIGEGNPGSVSFTGVTDPSPLDLASMKYAFDFDNDGTFDLGGNTYATSVSTASVVVPASFLLEGPGTRTVRGRVIDQDGGFFDSTTTITITNVAPTATLVGATVSENNPATISIGSVFDPSAADTAAGFLYSYDLDNDGTFEITNTTSMSAVVPATLLANGPFTLTARVRVFDRDGGFSDSTASVFVTNTPPTSSLTNGGTVVEGSNGTVSFGPVSDPSAADVAAEFRYAYDFNNDGTFEIGGSTYATSIKANSVSVPASFLDDGPSSRTIRARVYDQDGGFTDYTTTIMVTNVAPTANLNVSGNFIEGGSGTVLVIDQADSAPDLTTLKYAFDFNNDGTFDLGGDTYSKALSSASVSLPASALAEGPASPTIRVRVIDKDGGFVDITRTITVQNTAPTATLIGGTVAEGVAGMVSFANQTDPSPDDTAAGFRYAYDFDNDGTFEIGGDAYATATLTSTATVPASFLVNSGTRTVRGRIFDRDGGFSDTTATIIITNVAPTATIAIGGAVDEGSTATVSFANAFDPSPLDLAAVRYSYDFDNDGTFEIGGDAYANSLPTTTVTVPAKFLADGPTNPTVRGRVIDPDGGFTDYFISIPVNNVAPTLTLVGSTTIEGATGLVTVSSVFDLSAGDIAAGFRYAYDFDNDGTFDLGGTSYATSVPATSVTVPASFLLNSGTRVVRARVYDRDGGFSDATAKVVVNNVAPTAVLAPLANATEGTSPTISLSTIIDPSPADLAAGIRFAFDFNNDGSFDLGDGSYLGSVTSSSISAPASFFADGPGSRTIRVRVLDQDGSFTELSRSITITNVAPTATLVGGPIPEGGTGTVTFTNIVDVTADLVAGIRFALDFNNDGVFEVGGNTYATALTTPTATIPAALLADSGTRTIVGRVFDRDGGFSDTTLQLVVTNAVPTGKLTNNGPVSEGATATVTVTNANDGSPSDQSAGLRFSFDFDNNGTFEIGDGTYSNSVTTPSVTVPSNFLADGPFVRTVRVRILDQDGGFSDVLTAITVSNVAPTATFTTQPVVEGTNGVAAFTNVNDVSAADVGAGFTYRFDFNNDGTFDLTSSTPSIVVPAEFVPNGPATLTIRARIEDRDGGFTDSTASLTVVSAPPTGRLADGGIVLEGDTKTITVIDLFDPSPLDGAALRFAFDFDNDGTFEVGGNTYAKASSSPSATLPSSFLANGPATRTVAAAIIDPDGELTRVTTTFTIINANPTASLSNPGEVPEGAETKLTVTASDLGGDALRYAFDFDNDGTFDLGGNDFATAVTTPTVTIPASTNSGSRTVRVRTYDADGGIVDTTTSFTIVNVAPTAIFSGGTTLEATAGTVTFSKVVDASNDDATAGFTYRFDFDNDGTFDLTTKSPSVTVPASFLGNGPLDATIRGRVEDQDSGFTDYVTTISVLNAPPTGTLINGGTVTLGQPTVVRFTNVVDTASDLAAGLQYEFDIPGAKTITSKSPEASFTLANPGTFTITARVIDRDGGTTSQATTVTVNTVAPTAKLTGSTTTEGGTASVSFIGATHPAPSAVAKGFRYSFDFDNNGTFDLGDGTFAGSVTNAIASMPANLLLDSGTRTVRGRILEVNGGFTDVTTTVEVTNAAPTGQIEPPATTPNARQPFTISFANIIEPSGVDRAAGFSYSFDTNNDGTFEIVNSSSPTVSLNFTRPGTYPIVGRIVDQDGGTTTVTKSISVIRDPKLPPRGYAVGADAGGPPRALLYDASGKQLINEIVFEDSFTGGVRVATGDINGDGIIDLIVGSGPGRPTLVRVLNGANGRELFAVQPFEESFTGGVFVASGDLDADGKGDIIITPDEGGGPRVDVYSARGFTKTLSFFGIDDEAFRGGARANTGDLNGDGLADLLVVAGFGGGPRVAAFNGTTLGKTPQRLFGDFFVFEQTLRNGVYVSAGDLDGDGFAELIVGGGPGGGPRVLALSGKSLLSGKESQVVNFFAGDVNNRGGVRITASDIDDDGLAELTVGSGAGAGSRVTRYLGSQILSSATPPSEIDFDQFPSFVGGVFVG